MSYKFRFFKMLATLSMCNTDMTVVRFENRKINDIYQSFAVKIVEPLPLV